MTKQKGVEAAMARYAAKEAAERMANKFAEVEAEFSRTVRPFQESYEATKEEALAIRRVTEQEARRAYSAALLLAADRYESVVAPAVAAAADVRRTAEAKRNRALKALERQRAQLATVIAQGAVDGFAEGYAEASRHLRVGHHGVETFYVDLGKGTPADEG